MFRQPRKLLTLLQHILTSLTMAIIAVRALSKTNYRTKVFTIATSRPSRINLPSAGYISTSALRCSSLTIWAPIA